MKYIFTKEDLENAVKKSLSIANVCRELNIRPIGGNYKTLNNKFKKFNINISHFTGKAWNQGKRYRKFGKVAKLVDILIENSTYISTNNLKKKLIKEGLKENKCEECGIDEWNDKPITCELDHVNGNNMDNRIENLKILCPNCHSQTPSFRGRNKVSKISEKKKEMFEKYKDLKVEKKIKKKKRVLKEKLKCKICGIECIRNYKYCSRECYIKDNRKNIPKVPELIKSFKVYKNYCAVGRYYGVSDNAVRKWCDSYGINEIINQTGLLYKS